ncbi:MULTISPECIES: BTAD domain-containing putative transcriptional regulator [Amycolatopsis]|uniref:BTAD domain-containing putative transcriptional regulator n=1 Tax=Amycolatopsis albidoflavus TaxID=102226 RepID=A0ABW5HS29_9PSEU
MGDDLTPELTVQLLGDVHVSRGSVELDLGSSFRRGVFAVLACSAEHTVARHELVDALWGEAPPPSASGSLYTYVSDLRRVLEPGRPRRGDCRTLASVGSGYTLSVPRKNIDLFQFSALCETAQDLAANARRELALETVETALGLWRADALSGVPGPFAEAQRLRLAGVRLSALELRAELLLGLGPQTGLVDELRVLCAEHPNRESLRAQLMRALHGCGRTAEALKVFAEFQSILMDESGIEPSLDLRKLRQWLLDPVAEPAPASARPQVAAGGPAGSQKRELERTNGFVGRTAELSLLDAAFREAVAGHGGAVRVAGEPGIGKSALLAEAASEMSGAQVRWATAHELDTEVPFRLFADLLGLPADATPRGGTDFDTETAQAIAVVRKLCAEQPLVLVADDMQWADEASAATWRCLSELEGLPLLLISASRTTEAGTAGRGTVLSLGPLPPADVRRLVDRCTEPGRNPLYREAADGAGNPWYIRQIVACMDEAPPFADALPEQLVSLVSQHLTFLSEETLATIKYAAMLSRGFTADEVAAATGRTGTEVTARLQEATSAGILDRTEDRHEFRHTVVRQALYEQTPRALRGMLHRQLAEALAGIGVPPHRVAEHLVVVPAAADDWTAEWLTTRISAVAAERPQLAVQLLRQALGFGSLAPHTADLCSAILAWILLWLGEEPELEARSALARTEDPERAAEFRWILAHIYKGRGERDAALAEITEVLLDRRVTAEWRARHETLLSLLGVRPAGRDSGRGHTAG